MGYSTYLEKHILPVHDLNGVQSVLVVCKKVRDRIRVDLKPLRSSHVRNIVFHVQIFWSCQSDYHATFFGFYVKWQLENPAPPLVLYVHLEHVRAKCHLPEEVALGYVQPVYLKTQHTMLCHF